MNKIKVAIALVALCSIASFARQGSAQSAPTSLTVSPVPNPVSERLRQLLPQYSKNMIGAAQSMPAEKYGYKPTPEQITFAHLVLHVAQSNVLLCSKIGSAPPPQLTATDTDGKDKLVAAIQTSFDYCTQVLAKADDSNLGESLQLSPTRSMTKAGIMITLACDWYDHYSAQASYLRLNGILPPSAQPAPGR
ncbi:MAG TPA: DinB family protein [Candidatus Acidoferrum sp.]|nr:DinB family protein [Candidatus Acidoferrum sp.]